MVLDSVQSIHSKRNYAKAHDDLFAFCASRPLSRALLMEYRTTIDHLSASTISVRLSAIRKLIGEARRNGMIGLEEAANLTDIPNARQKGTRLGNWLTREQAKELLAVPDRSTLLLANPALCSMLGYRNDELCGMSCSRFDNPEIPKTKRLSFTAPCRCHWSGNDLTVI
jgi:PAS domain-containing protein